MVNVGGIPGRPLGQRRITNAEAQARWRLRHDRKRCSPDSPPGSGAHMNFLAPEMIVNLVPRANVDIDELVASGHRSMALYNKMIGRVERWLDKFADDEKVTIADLFKAYALLAPVLESLVVIRAKIGEQRAAEARDVTAQMQTDLQEGVKREAPKIQETLELMRRRFDDIIKPKAN
jgi:hypothetical protein